MMTQKGDLYVQYIICNKISISN